MDKFPPLTLPAIEYEAVEDLGRELKRYHLPSGCNPEATTFVDILYPYPEQTPRWNRKNANELPDLFPLEGHTDVKTPKLRVFLFRDASFLLERYRDKYRFARGNPTVQWMQQRFAVSPLFFRAAALPTFSSVQEHISFPYRDQAGKAARLDGYYYLRDCPYPGHRLVWFSHRLGGELGSTYITFNLPEATSRAIMACTPKALLQPLSLDLFFCEGILRLNQRALWKSQGSLFRLEEDEQLKSSLTPETAAATVTHLHGVARAFHWLRADLCDLRRTLHFLCSIADKFPLNSPQLSVGEMDSTTESLKYLKSQIEVILDHQSAGRERISTQIALFFNLSNQLDSRTNLDIARLTSEISISTQHDSSSMIT
ncbi:unnamed protein product [Cyclocybe aegerita]|uniref:Uncharacterized protein n=1 Tax=Cyclocybe aegerita TaxID=1973307 RepID=A0A8S0WNK6_CYCAE|nr:unnamed protein product [Cyclocybe aegerita]